VRERERERERETESERKRESLNARNKKENFILTCEY